MGMFLSGPLFIWLIWTCVCVCVLQRWCRVSELERAVSGLSSHHAAPEAADLPLPHPPRPGRVCGRPHRVHGTSSCSTPPSHTCVRFKAQKPGSFPDKRSLIFWVTNSDPLPRLLPVSVLVTDGKQWSWPPEEPETFYWYIKPDWSSVLSSPCIGSTPRSQRCYVPRITNCAVLHRLSDENNKTVNGWTWFRGFKDGYRFTNLHLQKWRTGLCKKEKFFHVRINLHLQYKPLPPPPQPPNKPTLIRYS